MAMPHFFRGPEATVTGAEFARVVDQNDQLRTRVRELQWENDWLRAHLYGTGEQVGCLYHYPFFVNGCSGCQPFAIAAREETST